MHYSLATMPSLRSLQSDFLGALLGAGQIEGRQGLYQSNVRINFSDSLRSTYPAVWRLVGEDYFRQTALMFQGTHPSRSGDLAHAGRGFPEYLAALHGDGQYRYLADIARLEWLCQEDPVLVVPGTSADGKPAHFKNVVRVEPTWENGLKNPTLFQCHQVRALDQGRFTAAPIGRLSPKDLRAIEEAVKYVLGSPP